MSDVPWNNNIKKAPYGKLLEVSNKAMLPRTIIASRGWIYNNMVHPDQTFFMDEYGGLVCPTMWRERFSA